MTEYDVQIGNTAYPLIFPLISSLDHVSPAINLTPIVLLSSNGGTYFVANGGVTEILGPGNIHMGVYAVAPNAIDAAVLGPLCLRVQGTGSNDPQDKTYGVVNYDPVNLPASVWSYGQRTVTGAMPVTFVNGPVSTDGTGLSLSRRYSYEAIYGNALQWAVETTPLSGSTVTLSYKKAGVWTLLSTGSFSGTFPNQIVTIPVLNSALVGLDVGEYDFALEANFSSNVVPLVNGLMGISE